MSKHKSPWTEAFELAKVMLDSAQTTGKTHLFPQQLSTSSVSLADDISAEWDPIEVRQALMWNQADWAEYWKEVESDAQKQSALPVATAGYANPTKDVQIYATDASVKGGAWKGEWQGQGHKAQVALRAEATTLQLAGITITAGPLRDVKFMAAYDVLVDLTGGTRPEVPVRIDGPLAAVLMTSVPTPTSFLSVSWPDMGVLALPRKFWGTLLAHVRTTPNAHLGIGCMAGLGRTGTALACLLRADNPKLTGPEAIAMVRKIYSRGAVETKDQEAYVASL